MSDPYSRVYWSIRSDERFARVYTDDAALAAWLRLLITADGVYPAPADIPAWLRPETLELLAESGLIDVVDSFHYRVHGLAAERERRARSGRAAASARWNANAYANADANAMRTHSERNATASQRALLDETRRDETRRDEDARAIAGDDGRRDLEAWLLVRRRQPTPRQREFLDAYCRTFDLTGPKRAERLILSNPDDPIAAMKADLDAFREERRAALPPEPARPQRKPRQLEPWREELRARLQAESAS